MGAKEQFIKDEKGRKVAVILPITDYEEMLEKLDELEDIKLYDEVKAKDEVADSFEEYLAKRKKSDV